MVQPDNTPAVTADAATSAVPSTAPDDVTPETSTADQAVAGEVTPDDKTAGTDESEIVEAELVPTSAPSLSPTTFPAAAPAPAFDYTDAGVPTLGYLQDKIERRYGNALGGTELAGMTPEAKSAAEVQAEREKAAVDKLEEIRRSLHPDP